MILTMFMFVCKLLRKKILKSFSKKKKHNLANLILKNFEKDAKCALKRKKNSQTKNKS